MSVCKCGVKYFLIDYQLHQGCVIGSQDIQIEWILVETDFIIVEEQL